MAQKVIKNKLISIPRHQSEDTDKEKPKYQTDLWQSRTKIPSEQEKPQEPLKKFRP
jgi:hypothetical protein